MDFYSNQTSINPQQNHENLILLVHIFRGQVASLMLCDRTKKKMTFVGLEPTPPAIRAVALTN